MIKHAITALALTLSLASSAVQAQETNCDGWAADAASDSWEIEKHFWKAATPETVADCLNSGSSVNDRIEYGTTSLHRAAAYNKNPEVLTVLLEAGADVNTRSEYGFTPLHSAAWNTENPEVLTVLLEAGADVNVRSRDGRSPLLNVTEN